MIQRKIFRFGVLAALFLLPLCALAQKGEKIQTIVIDAGHGGKDTGALGKVTTEKALNLAVALKFGAYIEENMPDVKVIYTRKTDKFIELSERAAIANRNNADVFINFDPNSTEAYILFSLSQSLYQSQSLNIADKVQKQFAAKGRHDRGVQQAGFLVLWKTAMPSILVELGFINNNKEEQFLNSEKGQTQMALALYRAFEEYKREFESENHTSDKPVAQERPTASGDTYFSVQFASRDKKVSSTDKAFSGVKEVDVYEYNGAFRYISGRFTTKAEATKRQAEVRALGYKDAFVIAFINGERGTIKQAEEALRKK